MEQSDSTAAPIDPQYYMTCPECKLSILKTDYIPHYWERHRDIVYLKYRGRKGMCLKEGANMGVVSDSIVFCRKSFDSTRS